GGWWRAAARAGGARAGGSLCPPRCRQAAIRLLWAAVWLVAVARVRAIVRASVERRAAWGAGALGEAWPGRRDADPRLARFRDEIRFSVRSHSYFEHLLWPRLVALARARGANDPEALAKPPGRRFGPAGRHGAAGAPPVKLDRVTERSREILDSLASVIVGKGDVLERILAGILASGHVLIEDYPGLAKTLIARLFAQALGLSFKRL